MKKIFTIILAAAGTIGAASAQSFDHKSVAYNDHQKINNDHARPSFIVKRNDVNYNDAYFSYKEKQEKIERINHDYDQKIASVKYDRRLSRKAKARQIDWLQSQRKNELSKVDFQYAKSGHKTANKSFGRNEHKW